MKEHQVRALVHQLAMRGMTAEVHEGAGTVLVDGPHGVRWMLKPVADDEHGPAYDPDMDRLGTWKVLTPLGPCRGWMGPGAAAELIRTRSTP